MADKFTVMENLFNDVEAKLNLVEENTPVMESKTTDVGNKLTDLDNKLILVTTHTPSRDRQTASRIHPSIFVKVLWGNIFSTTLFKILQQLSPAFKRNSISYFVIRIIVFVFFLILHSAF